MTRPSTTQRKTPDTRTHIPYRSLTYSTCRYALGQHVAPRTASEAMLRKRRLADTYRWLTLLEATRANTPSLYRTLDPPR